MKVIIIRSVGIDAAVFKMANSLAKHGYDVHLLVWDRQKNITDENKEMYHIHRFKLPAPYGSMLALLFLPIWWLYEFYFLMHQDAKIFHSCDLDTLYPAILASLIKGNILFYTIYDFYANHLPENPFYTKSLRDFIARLEKFGIAFTKCLFIVDECRLEQVKGAKISQLEFIYNSPPDYFNSQKHFDKECSPAHILIFYAGLIRWDRGLEYMIQAVKEIDRVKLVLAGKIIDKEIIDDCANGERIQYIGWIPTYEGVLEWTTRADILFRFGNPTHPKAKYESPNKVFEAMMTGIPILVNYGLGSASRIVEQENCGLIVPYGDINALKEAIIMLRDNPGLRRKLGKNGRKAYEIKYSWNRMEERLVKRYSEVES